MIIGRTMTLSLGVAPPRMTRALSVVVLLLAACSDAPKPSAARGQYLVDSVGMCGYCHTPLAPDNSPDPARKLGGFRDRFDLGAAGVQSAPNLTPDATGLRDWSDEEIKRVLRQGILRNGEVMWWTMPYFETANYTEEDLDSIVLYLRSLPPVENALPPRLPYTARSTPYLPLSGDIVPPTTLAPNALTYERAQRGRYLASVGCMGCHTPFANGDYRRDITKIFGGNLHFSVIPPFELKEVESANLTPDPTNGTTLTATQIRDTLRRSGTSLCGPMSYLVQHYYSNLTEDDAMAIGIYLKNIRPVDTGPIPSCTP
jgi:mono/diheme cytochrome c family protein